MADWISNEDVKSLSPQSAGKSSDCTQTSTEKDHFKAFPRHPKTKTRVKAVKSTHQRVPLKLADARKQGKGREEEIEWRRLRELAWDLVFDPTDMLEKPRLFPQDTETIMRDIKAQVQDIKANLSHSKRLLVQLLPPEH